MARTSLSITIMYKRIKISIKIDGKQSKEFEKKVGIHQDFVFSPLLFLSQSLPNHLSWDTIKHFFNLRKPFTIFFLPFIFFQHMLQYKNCIKDSFSRHELYQHFFYCIFVKFLRCCLNTLLITCRPCSNSLTLL